VAIGRKGDIVVSEFDSHCISVYRPSGEKLRSFGTYGSGRGEFWLPRGVAVDEEGNIAVVDSKNNRIQKFTAEGRFVAAVGNGDGVQLKYPRGIAFNPANQKLYVADKHHLIHSDLTFSASFGSHGRDKAKLWSPRGVACDKGMCSWPTVKTTAYRSSLRQGNS
jgi:DNA-binding beta-propeller fold protein YncE